MVRNLLDNKLLQPLPTSPAHIMVTNLNPNLIHTYLQVSQTLRQAGFNVWTKLGNRKLRKQLEYADRLGIPLCVIIGSDEHIAGKCCLKNLNTREQFDVLLKDLVDRVKNTLNTNN